MLRCRPAAACDTPQPWAGDDKTPAVYAATAAAANRYDRRIGVFGGRQRVTSVRYASAETRHSVGAHPAWSQPLQADSGGSVPPSLRQLLMLPGQHRADRSHSAAAHATRMRRLGRLPTLNPLSTALRQIVRILGYLLSAPGCSLQLPRPAQRPYREGLCDCERMSGLLEGFGLHRQCGRQAGGTGSFESRTARVEPAGYEHRLAAE